MSREDFSRIVRRILEEPSYAERVKKDPEGELKGLSLTSSELRVARETDPETLSMLVDAIEARAAGNNGCSGGTNGCRAAALAEESLTVPASGSVAPSQ